MLEAARQRAHGVDVVVGLGRDPRTAPRPRRCCRARAAPARKVDYRGVTLEEFDLDAALARKPALVLVDELAHTNAAGSRHTNRWQDIDDLLAAGIDVYTTVNVQHLESLNDVVAQITGVVVRETVPDSRHRAGRRASSSSTCPPTSCSHRLEEGKVYVPEQARARWRELLPEGQPDRAPRARAARGPPSASTPRCRVSRDARDREDLGGAASGCSCASGPSPPRPPGSRRRGAWPRRLHAPWIAAYVETPDSAPDARTARSVSRPPRAGRAARRRDRRAAGERAVRRAHRLRAHAQRHADRGRQADPLAGAIGCAARSSTSWSRQRRDRRARDRAASPRRVALRQRRPEARGRASVTEAARHVARRVGRRGLITRGLLRYFDGSA